MKRFIALFCCILLLTGCGKDVPVFDPGTPVPLQIPLYDGSVVNIAMPSTLTLLSTDNHVFWDYSDGVALSVMTSTDASLCVPTQYDNVYTNGNTIVRTFDSCSLIVECPPHMLTVFLDLVGKTVQNIVVPEFDIKYRLEALPTYNNVEMYLDNRNFYMPADSVLNEDLAYLSSIHTSGVDWIECWTKDCIRDDVVDLFESLAIVNTDSDNTSWYMSDDIVYVEHGNNICGAKRLAYNSWYIYFSSLAYKDYVLQGLNTIRRAD